MLLGALLLSCCAADLRKASQPRNDFKVRDRSRDVPFVPEFSIYMEPSDFNYAGLVRQRDTKGYDK